MKAFVLALFLIPLTAQADKWVVIVVNEAGVTSIKMDSITQDGPYAKAWFSVEPGIEKTSGGFLYDRAKYVTYFDCKNKTFSTSSMDLYLKDSFVGAVYGSEEKVFESTMPQTLMEKSLMITCDALGLKYK